MRNLRALHPAHVRHGRDFREVRVCRAAKHLAELLHAGDEVEDVADTLLGGLRPDHCHRGVFLRVGLVAATKRLGQLVADHRAEVPRGGGSAREELRHALARVLRLLEESGVVRVEVKCLSGLMHLKGRVELGRALLVLRGIGQRVEVLRGR